MKTEIAEPLTANLSEMAQAHERRIDEATGALAVTMPASDGKANPTGGRQTGKKPHVPMSANASQAGLLSRWIADIDSNDSMLANPELHAALFSLVEFDLAIQDSQFELGRFVEEHYAKWSRGRQEIFCAKRLDWAAEYWSQYSAAKGLKGKNRIAFNPSQFKTDAKGKPISGLAGVAVALYAPFTPIPKFADVVAYSPGRKATKAQDRVRYARTVYLDYQKGIAAASAARSTASETPEPVPETERETLDADREPAAPKGAGKPGSARKMYQAMYQAVGQRKRTLKNGNVLYFKDVVREAASLIGHFNADLLSKWEDEIGKKG